MLRVGPRQKVRPSLQHKFREFVPHRVIKISPDLIQIKPYPDGLSRFKSWDFANMSGLGTRDWGFGTPCEPTLRTNNVPLVDILRSVELHENLNNVMSVQIVPKTNKTKQNQPHNDH